MEVSQMEDSIDSATTVSKTSAVTVSAPEGNSTVKPHSSGMPTGGPSSGMSRKQQKRLFKQEARRSEKQAFKENRTASDTATKKRKQGDREAELEEPIYDIKVHRAGAAYGKWDENAQAVDLTKMRGNFWKITGFSAGTKNYLNVEEAMYLVERAQMYIHSDDVGDVKVKSSVFYKKVMSLIPQECYLVYAKLKNLEYIVRRNSTTNSLVSFRGDKDVYDYLKLRPSLGLLEGVCSFELFANKKFWSKKTSLTMKPVSYVVVLKGHTTLSARLTMALLDEADGVPILFAAVTSSSHIILEEFTDARRALNAHNSVALRPFWLPEMKDGKDTVNEAVKSATAPQLSSQGERSSKSFSGNENYEDSSMKKSALVEEIENVGAAVETDDQTQSNVMREQEDNTELKGAAVWRGEGSGKDESEVQFEPEKEGDETDVEIIEGCPLCWGLYGEPGELHFHLKEKGHRGRHRKRPKDYCGPYKG
jgi:hypothetical protein